MELVTLNGTPVSCLGLASQAQQETACVPISFEAGINYFFFYNLSSEPFLNQLKRLLEVKRERIFVATGSEYRNLNTLNQTLDRVREALNIEVVDAFFAEYVSPQDQPSDVQALIDELYAWKSRGDIRFVGVSTHNRAIACNLVKNHRCDVLMHRYNMAHRRAETDVLPAANQAGIPVIAFTCTRWGTLLEKPIGWTQAAPTAADCYRFSLHPAAVRIALTSPATLAELESNLEVLRAPALTAQELSHWQQFGDIVYGTGQDAFETQWL